MTKKHLFLAAAAMLVWCGTAWSVTDSGSWGRNRLNQTIALIDNKIVTYKNDRRGRRTDLIVSEVPFDEECTWVGQSPISKAHALDCRNGRASPLAGAYFNIRNSKRHRSQCGLGAVIYECDSGCQSPEVARVFVEEPYEC